MAPKRCAIEGEPVNTWSRSRLHPTVLSGTPVTADPQASRIGAGHGGAIISLTRKRPEVQILQRPPTRLVKRERPLATPIDALPARFYGECLAARRGETTMTSVSRRHRFQLVHA
jgi:hypothetical protein